MRRFLRDVVLRSAEIIKEREQKAKTPLDNGRPSKCIFCEDHPDVVVVHAGKQAFLCGEHLGSFVVDWTTDKELTVVRL
jgi:hypothetical protein